MRPKPRRVACAWWHEIYMTHHDEIVIYTPLQSR